MGKNNKSNKGKGGKVETKQQQCKCDHPYQCNCGNRPERPSRGHKWDPTTQTWGGKGHKQKGGSGQTASVAQEAKVTEKGNTVLKQWQKLPSKLLCDLCKKNGKALGKGLPIYRPVNNRGIADNGGEGGGKKKYRYRLIIPDTSKKKGSSSSSSDHDIVLTPTLSVSNEEQAKEEAALLGLLYLFPKLPHERTLPEPYRSTFLAALKNNQNDNNNAAATPNKDGNKNDNEKKNDNNIKKQPTTTLNQSDTGATANTQLTANLPSFHLKNNNNTSKRDTASTSSKSAAKSTQQHNQPPLLTRAQINEAKRQHQREVQSRIRKHEAIRNANKPMEVFMSARFRKRIECLLSGNVFDEEEEDDYDNDGGDDKDINDDDEEGVLQSYVHQRLVHEGFSSKQVTKAYREVMKKKKMNNATKDGNQNEYDDQTMDKVYDETLQYLCIHLNEDQLPIGFDPRGGTLDVVRPTATREKTKQKKNEKKRGGEEAKNDNDDVDATYDTNILQLAEYFGLTPREAFAIYSSDKDSFSSTSEELAMKRAFWKVIGDAASLPISRTCFGCDASSISDEDKVMNKESAANECEALEAIFEEGEFSIKQYEDTFTRVAIALPFGGVDEDTKLSLEVHYVNGLYPSLLPMVFVTSGNLNGRDKSNKKYQFGGRLHLEIAKYLKESINAGQEVIFELFGEVQSMLQKEEEEPSASVDGAEVSELLSHLKLDSGIGSNDSNSSNDSGQTQSKTNDPAKESNEVVPNQAVEGQIPRKQQSKPLWRPRERATFWNTKPSKTPPAECFPKLGPLLERARKSLPAAKAKKDFISLMSDAKKTGGRVVLVTGETGCGKTTQIPQFILEEAPLSKIIVAQPRRLAATGVASRVALERGESEPGKASVGYVVRGDSKICGSTRLMFCTTGVLLRQLQAQNALENITHILVDEVHERHLDTDVLLAILKKTLPSLPNLTVVLMSATMDADRFAKYWGTSTPRIHIPGFTHPVQDFTLEDVLEMTNYIPPKKKKKQSQYSRGGRAAGGGSYQIQPSFVDGEELGDDGGDSHIEKNTETACAVPLEERLKRMSQDEIDYDLIAVLIQTILQTKNDDGSMLVFLPGSGEIDRAERVIQSIVRGNAIMILPLHGGLQPEKQQQVFVPARKGYCKIILSTNVAETSITIPDCTIVIDTCKEKKSSFDPVNRMPLLLECYASRDSLKQRRGRAGRVRPGTCYKLISSSKHNKLPEHGEPEIRRCALDQTLLSLMFLGLENGSGSFLELMLDPPSEQSIQSALYSLEKTGALTRGGDQAFLTPLGTHLSGIPAPPVVGKLLVMGCLLGCRDMAVAVAAGLSAGRNPFLRINTFNNGNRNGKDSIEQEKEQYKNNMILEARADLFKTVGKSDHAMLGKAFLLWKECKGHSERRKYCDKMGLASMRDILALTRQLDSSLTTSGFLPSNHCNRNETSWRIVRSMLVASLSPTQTVRVQKPSTKYTETIEGAVEKDGKARELKFFIRGGGDDDNQTTNNVNRNNEERVFIHPSSNNFAVGSYSCPWLVYHRLVRTSKAFVSDATECNSYSLLLFGGSMEVQASRGLIVLDDWIRLSANARIGSLIGGLRQKVDELLDQKVADPSLDITDSIEMKLITDLLRHDGV